MNYSPEIYKPSAPDLYVPRDPDTYRFFAERMVLSEQTAHFIEYLDLEEEGFDPTHGTRKKSTQRVYIWALKVFFQWLAASNIQTPTRTDMIAFKKHLKTVDAGIGRLNPHTGEITKTKPLKDTSRRFVFQCVCKFFSWTEYCNIYPDITRDMKKPRQDKYQEKHRRKAFTSEQIHQILEAIDCETDIGKRDKAIVLLAVTSALRKSELIFANVEDLYTEQGKNLLKVWGKDREGTNDVVPVSDVALEAIQDYLACVRPHAKPGEPLFTSENRSTANLPAVRRRISDNGMYKIIKKRIVSVCGYDPTLTPHSLRHTGITAAINQGEDYNTVREFARHTSLDTTMVYVHSAGIINNHCAEAAAAGIFGEPETDESAASVTIPKQDLIALQEEVRELKMQLYQMKNRPASPPPLPALFNDADDSSEDLLELENLL